MRSRLCGNFARIGNRQGRNAHETLSDFGGADLLRLPLSLPARAQVAGSDHFSTSGGAVDIVPIHHASLMLTYKGQHILIDPAPLDGAQGDAVTAPYKAMPQPDFILITHIHGDHFNAPILEAVAGPEHRDRRAAECARRHARRSSGQDQGDEEWRQWRARRGAGRGGGDVQHHAGAAELPSQGRWAMAMSSPSPTSASMSRATPKRRRSWPISPISTWPSFPVNLPYTQTVEAAAKWVKDFQPKMVFPYHYRNQDGSTSDMAAFSTLVGNASLVRLRKWY